MGIDITKHISELLYEHDSVIIPELGGIVTTYQSASIDHVQGLLHPPSKKLTFNENLLINDGLLVDYIKGKHNISFKESVDEISRFVLDINEKLNNKEIVILPQIGRLYRDYENNLRFLQDATNFNKNVFGLPTLQFYPVLRSQDAPIKKSKPIKLVSKQSRFGLKKSVARKIASTFLPLLIGIAITVLAIGVYKKGNVEVVADAAFQKIPVNENRINQKPSIDNLSLFESLSDEEPFENEVVTESEKTAEIASRKAAIPEEQKEGVIIIGVFSKKEGVEKRVKDIYNFGYDAYQDKMGKLTRVGVLFGYDHESEIKKMLNIMRDKFDSHAWVLEE